MKAPEHAIKVSEYVIDAWADAFKGPERSIKTKRLAVEWPGRSLMLSKRVSKVPRRLIEVTERGIDVS